MKCNWKITSPVGTKITLKFDDFSTQECCDKLKIFDGPSPTSVSSYTIASGTKNYVDWHSTGDSIYLEFEADSGIDYRGFKISYSWEGKTMAMQP